MALDAFLTTVYTVIDDLYQRHVAPRKPRRPGRRPVMSDSEVLTVLLVGQWLGRAERELLRYAARHWRAYFPRLLSQSAFNRRGRDLAGVLVELVPLLAQTLAAPGVAYEALDSVPVPLARRCRGAKHKLFGWEAAIGHGGSDRGFYYGCRLLLAVTNTGRISGFCVGPANTDDRWLTEALLCWRQDPQGQPWTPADLPPSHRAAGYRQGPTGPVWPRQGAGQPGVAPYLADQGFRGGVWVAHWQTAYGGLVLTPAQYQQAKTAPVRRQHSRLRQVVETVNGHLERLFQLWYPQAKTVWGLRTRLAAKLCAFNLGVALCEQHGRNRFALNGLFW